MFSAALAFHVSVYDATCSEEIIMQNGFSAALAIDVSVYSDICIGEMIMQKGGRDVLANTAQTGDVQTTVDVPKCSCRCELLSLGTPLPPPPCGPLG